MQTRTRPGDPGASWGWRFGVRRLTLVAVAVIWLCAPMAHAQAPLPDDEQAEAEAVLAIGRNTTSPNLAVLLHRSDNKYIRGIAALWLGERGYTPARPALFVAIDDPAVYVQRRAAVAYARLGGCMFEDAMMQLYTSPRQSTRFAAIGASIEILDRCDTQTPLGIPVLMRGASGLVHDPDPQVRREAVVLLRNLPHAILAERGTTVLLAALQDPDAQVRSEAVRALFGLKGRKVARALLPLLDDPDPVVQRHAVRVLAATGDPVAIRAVRNLLGSRKAHVRVQGIRALVTIGDPAVGGDLSAMLSDRSNRVRREAVLAIARLHPPREVALLAQAAHDVDAAVRLAAVRALLDICPSDDPDPAVLRAVAWAAGDRKQDVATAAVAVLRCMRSKAAVPHIITAFCATPHLEIRRSLGGLLKAITFTSPGTRCMDWRQWLEAEQAAGGTYADSSDPDRADDEDEPAS